MWVGPHDFWSSTNCRTRQNKYELVAPNIRRSVFGVLSALEFSKEIRQSRFDVWHTYDTKSHFMIWVKWSCILTRKSCLRFQKVMLKMRSIRKISELILSWNKSEKDVAKIMSLTIMRFPRWTSWLPLQSLLSGLFGIVWRLTSSHLFLAIARKPSGGVSQVGFVGRD